MKQLSMFGRADRARASRTAEIPEWMGRILWVRSRGELMKGAGHKYIRRVPTKNPPPRYRYFYSAGGGAGLGHADEIATGAAFKLSHGGQDGHFHVVAEGEGDTVRVRHDETGHEVEITRAALAAMLHREHASLVTAHAKRAAEDLHAVRRHGTDAQRARVEARVLRYQHTAHLAAPPASATKDGPAWRSAADGAGGAGLRILSLFSGAGGFDMGLHAALPHARTTGLCEIDPYARKVLARAFPGVAQHEDVNTLASGEDKPAERPNMIIGGFPCQDLSAANVRAKGLSGERSGLYRKMRDIIEGQNPDWVVFENVPLLRSRGLDVVLMDMQALGYEVTWDSISGASVGAPHQRDRVFVVCHRPGVKLDWQRPDREITGHHWQSDPPPLRDSGTHRQTRIAHTVLAGNAVIPQVAEHLGEIIGGSSPGQAEPTGKEIARWTGDAWVSPKGKPVVKFPRAGLLRDGVVYQNEHTKQDGGGIREGDKVWVRNTDSAGDGDVYDAEQRLALDHLTRNTTIPRRCRPRWTSSCPGASSTRPPRATP